MSQNFDSISASDKVRDSRLVFLQRDESLRSNFSGNSFPSGVGVVVGMSCYRTDLGQKFECTAVTGTGVNAVGTWLGSFSADPENNPAMTAAQVGLSGVAKAGSDQYLRYTNAFGYAQIGTANASFAYLTTDAPRWFLSAPTNINGEVRIHGTGTYFNSTNGYINNGEIWHSGNDGPGSGLDADTLDGLQGSDFLRSNAEAVIGAAYSLSFQNSTRQMLNLWSTSYGMGVQSSTLYARTGGSFSVFRGGVHNNSARNAGTGGTEILNVSSSGIITTPRYGDLESFFVKKSGNQSIAGTLTTTGLSVNGTSRVNGSNVLTEATLSNVAKGTLVAVIQERYTRSTSRLASVANSWRRRVLNHLALNTGGAISNLSSSAFTVTVDGWVEWAAPAYACNHYSTRLINVTDGNTVVAEGTAGYVRSNTAAQADAKGGGPVVAGKTYAIEMRTLTARSEGLGYERNGQFSDMTHAVFARVKLYTR